MGTPFFLPNACAAVELIESVIVFDTEMKDCIFLVTIQLEPMTAYTYSGII